MIKTTRFLFLTILALGLSSARAEDKNSDAVSQLKALDMKLTDAFKAHDYETLAKNIEDGYMLIDPRGGVHTKKQYLEHLSKGSSTVKDLSETDVKGRVFGDTGVVT